MSSAGGPLLTLEPFIEAVRAGVESAGWLLSGLQKTTSHEFAGRWEGESTRSAYLFFHRADGEGVGVEAFLDETARGMQGNLSLVLDGPPLDRLGDARAALSSAMAIVRRRLARAHRATVSLKLRANDAGDAVGDAASELRIKIRVPQGALHSGGATVAELAVSLMRGFESILEDPDLAGYSDSQ